MRLAFIVLLLLFRLPSFAQEDMEFRTENLTYLLNPGVPTYIEGIISTAPDNNRLYLVRMDIDQFHFLYRDTAKLLNGITDLFWDYAIGNNHADYDSVMLALLDTVDLSDTNSLSGRGIFFPKARNEVKELNMQQRMKLLTGVLIMYSVGNLVPEKLGTSTLEVFLYSNETAVHLPMEKLEYYAKTLPYVMVEYVLKNDYKTYPYIILKLIGEHNMLLRRYVVSTKWVYDYLKNLTVPKK